MSRDDPPPDDTVSLPPGPSGPGEGLRPPGRPGELGRLGGYRALGLLGEGGMGRVYRAEGIALGRQVVLKVMRPELAARPEARARFLREARAAAALHHDHVMPVFHVGEDGGTPFIVMPLLSGETLEDRLKRERHLPPMFDHTRAVCFTFKGE